MPLKQSTRLIFIYKKSLFQQANILLTAYEKVATD